LLGDAFGGAHDGGGLDRLVGGKKNDAGVMRGGGAGEGFCGEDVVGDGGERMLLHQRDVLECCGVEDDGRGMRGEDVFEKRGVGGAAEDGCDRGGWGEFGGEGVEVALRGLKQGQVMRVESGQAMREGGADGAAGAGNEDGLAREGSESLGPWRWQRRTGEEAVPVDVGEGGDHRRSINWARMGVWMRSKGWRLGDAIGSLLAYT